MLFRGLTAIQVSALLFLTVLSAHCRATEEQRPAVRECLSREVAAWGEAPVFTGIEDARARAREAACRSIVRSCIGENHDEFKGIADSRPLTDAILPRFSETCNSGRVLEEKRYKRGSITLLRVYARFRFGDLDSYRPFFRHRLMILIRETY